MRVPFKIIFMEMADQGENWITLSFCIWDLQKCDLAEWKDKHTQFLKFIDDNTDAWLYLSNTPMLSALVSYPVHFHRLREHPNYWQLTRQFNLLKDFSTWAWDSCSSFPLPYFSAPGSRLFSNLRSRRIRRREKMDCPQRHRNRINPSGKSLEICSFPLD